MSDATPAQSAPEPPPEIPADTVVRKSTAKGSAALTRGGWLTFRRPVPFWAAMLLGLACIAFVFGLWWFLTRGATYEDRIIPYGSLPSPAETFHKDQLERLWFDNELTRNLFVSLRRVVSGFALAAAFAIPLGVLCGCFPWVNAFFAPINLFGRNIPIAALIPLTYALFSTGETQKVMFIFIAVVAFIMMDTASAIADVSSRYIDTAYTLGASRIQIILKVLVPLAMPRIFNSLRLLFGLAFGYIMLVELIKEGDVGGGLGNIINVAQRRSHRETIILILFVIPAVALVIDRFLFIVQKSLFPHQYGGRGVLHHAWRGVMHAAEGVKNMIVSPRPISREQKAALTATPQREAKPAAS